MIGPMALGSVGWVMPGVKADSEIFYSYRYWTEKGGLYLPDKRYAISVPHLQEVRGADGRQARASEAHGVLAGVLSRSG